MDISTAALIAEIIGAISLVISLIYLAMQVRAQNSEARIAAMHDIFVGYRESLADFADPVSAILFDKSLEDYDSLTRVESIRLIAIIGRCFRVWEEAFMQHQASRLNERMWQSMLRQFQGYMATAPFQKTWELRRDYFDPEFAAFVKGLEKTDYRFQ